MLGEWAHLGSNQGPLACEASALPLSYAPGRGRVPGLPGTFLAWRPRRSHRRVSGCAGGRGAAPGRPWRVIVLNDDHNTFQGVAYAISNVLPGVSYEDGMALATRIHETGQAIVWSGEKETAELYWTELHDFGLTMAPLEQ